MRDTLATETPEERNEITADEIDQQLKPLKRNKVTVDEHQPAGKVGT